MGGFQLWTNLPASHKMMDPRYRDVKSDQIPEIVMGNGVTIRIICGEVNGTKGPVRDIVTDPEYLDVIVLRGSSSSIRPNRDTPYSPTLSRARDGSAGKRIPTPTSRRGRTISISSGIRL